MNKEKIYELLTPETVYLPFGDNSNIYLKTGSRLLLYEVFANNNGVNYYSFASGIAIGKAHITSTLGLNNAIVIQNDFKETKVKNACIINETKNYKRKYINDILKSMNIYKSFKGKKVLYVTYNFDKHVNCDSLFFKENVLEILDAIYFITSIYKLEKAIIVSNNDKTLVKELEKYIGTYLNISIENIFNKKFDKMLKLSSNISYDMLNIYEVYTFIKYNKYLKNKYISVKNRNNNFIVNIKLGTNLYNLLSYLNITSFSNIKVYGSTILDGSNTTIITKDVYLLEII